MNLSQKDSGNECFKCQKYSEAIEHYERYVCDDHLDNKNAYFNLSLCYSKLKKPFQSVEAAEKAKQIDKSYIKCYYRLALEYQKIPHREYEIFINATHFQRVAGSEQHAEKQEMKKLSHNYQNFLCKNNSEVRKIQNLDEIILESAALFPENESVIEVDKNLDEWLVQWNQDIQTQDAKWVQIEYIMEQIDYEHGKNLAYFYINQLKDVKTKQATIGKLREVKSRLGKEKIVNIKDLDIDLKEEAQISKQSSSDGDTDHQTDILNKKINTISQVKNSQIESKSDVYQIESKKEQQNLGKKVVKNPKKALQQKKFEQMRKKVDNINNVQNESQTFKELKQQIEKNKKTQIKSDEPKKKLIQPSVQPQNTALPKQSSNNDTQNAAKIDSSLQSTVILQSPLQDLYQKMTVELTHSKEIFSDTYRCVVKILQSKSIQSSEKGWLIVELRKRVKKFKRIMQATSENEQKIVFDLLKQSNLEEYAMDVSPMFKDI